MELHNSPIFLFLSPFNKLNHTLLWNPPPVPNPESLNLPRMQQLQHRILSNLQELLTLLKSHNFRYISIHKFKVLSKK